MGDIPDLVTSHKSELTVQDLVDRLTQCVARKDLSSAADLLSTITERAQQLQPQHVDTILHIAGTFSESEPLQVEVLTLLTKVTTSLPSCLIDARFNRFIINILKSGNVSLQKEALGLILKICTSKDDEIQNEFIQLDNFYVLTKALVKVFKLSLGSMTIVGILFSIFMKLFQLDIKTGYVFTVKRGPKVLCSLMSSSYNNKNRIVDILNLLLSLSEDIRIINLMFEDEIHVKVVEVIKRNKKDCQLLTSAFEIVENISISKYHICRLLETGILKLLIDHLNVAISADGFQECLLKCLKCLQTISFELDDHRGQEVMDVIYTLMSQYRGDAIIQNSTQHCLLRILSRKRNLISCIGEQPEQIPLSTFILGNILMHGKCTQTLATSCQLLCCILQNTEVQGALGSRNIHIAIDANMRYHKYDVVILSLSYKVLHRLCHRNIDIANKLIHYGFLNTICSLLTATHVGKGNLDMTRNAVILLTKLYQQCAHTINESTTKHLAELVQNLLLDVYKLNQDLTENCIKSLLQMWGSLTIQTATCHSLIALTLDCMDVYADYIKIQRGCLKLLQLFSSCDLPQSVIIVCSKLLKKYYRSSSKANVSGINVQEDIIVLCYLLAQKDEVTALWIAQSDILMDLLEVYQHNSPTSVLSQLVCACVYALSEHQHVKSLLLEKASCSESVLGVACILVLGASMKDMGTDSALVQACKIKNSNIVSMLLEKPIADLKTPLKVALELDCPVIVGMLIRRLNEGSETGTVNCSNLGLYDLQALWFSPLLEGNKVDIDDAVISQRKQGEILAASIQQIGEELKYCKPPTTITKSNPDPLLQKQSISDDPTSAAGTKQDIESRRTTLPADITQKGDFTQKGESGHQIQSSPNHGKEGVSHSASYSRLSQFTSAFHRVERQTDGQMAGPHRSRSAVQLFDNEPEMDLKEELRQSGIYHPEDPRILLDLKNETSLHGHNHKDYGTTLTLSSSDSNIYTGRRKSKSGSLMFPMSQLPSMPENEEMTRSTCISRSVSIISFDTSISCASEISDTEITVTTRRQSPPCLKELHQFDLSNNLIGRMDGLLNLGHSALYRLRHLHKLAVSHNKLSSIPCQLLQYLPGLHEVHLSHNVLQKFPVCLFECKSLEIVDLSYNQMTDVTMPSDYTVVSHVKDLNLANNQLAAFPTSLCNAMSEIKVLNLGSNQISRLPVKGVTLNCVESLDLSYNKIQTVGDGFCSQLPLIKTLLVQGNYIEELPSSKLGVKLHDLSHLDVSNNLIGHNEENALEFISCLSRLKNVKLCGNGLTSFCKTNQLRTPVLSELDLGHNNINRFDLSGPVKVYSKLKKLNLSHNQLTQLPKEIGELSSLCSLDISHNRRLTTLPDHMGKLNRLWQLKTEGLKLDIDSSLLHGRIRDLIGYLHERLKKSVEYNQLKLMCVGFGGRGKTSLIRGLVRQRHPVSSLPTVGIIVKEWKYGANPFVSSYTLHVWDFAGQEDFYSTHQCFMSDRALYMVVYNLSLGLIEIENMKPWLQNIHARAPQCPVIIVGTHWDKVAPEERDQLAFDFRSRIKHLCDGPGYPPVIGMVEVDCLHENSRLDRLRGIIHDVVTSHKVKGQPLIGHKVPASYVKLQELLLKELNEMKKPFPVITKKRLHAIVEKGKLDLDQEELKQAVRFLHTCGIILHYEDSTLKLDDFYFLDPEWLCRMMAQIITVREINPCIGTDGILKKQDIGLLFTGKKIGEHRKYVFPPSLIPQYLVLLHKFEIALPLGEDQWLVPARLSTLRPDFNLPDTNDPLIRRIYSMNYIPAGLWSRLLTRILVTVRQKLNSEFSTIYWREGIYVLYKATAFFLVDSPNPNTIQVTVPSTSEGSWLLGEVVSHLDILIDEWYPGLLEVSPTGQKLLSIKVPCVKCSSEDAYYFSLDDIINQSDVVDWITCPKHRKESLIKDLAPDVVLADIHSKYHINRTELQFDDGESSVIGDGSLSRVYKGTYNYTPVAVKKFESTAVETLGYKALRQEALILSKLHHPSLVQMVAVETQKKLLVLELAPFGSLRKVFSDEIPMTRVIKHRMALQIAEGLEYLHQHMIIYRDMKPDNILVFSLFQGKRINVKISDYGIACVVTPGGGIQSQEGTPGYRAPEIINRENYSLKADMFSYGVTIYELITDGKHPYGEPGSGYQLDENIAQGIQPQPITSHVTSLWNVMEDVIGQCLSLRPYNRPLPSEVMKQLSEVESLCLRQSIILSKQLQVDALIAIPGEDEGQDVMVACGGVDSSEITYINMEANYKPQGSLFPNGQVLCMLYLTDKDVDLLILGTLGGIIYVVDTTTWLLRENTCNIGDSILCLARVHSQEGCDYLLAGTAGGRLAIFTVQNIMQQLMEPEVLQLGTGSEPVNCICTLSKPAVYVTVATRIYRLRLHPRVVLETKYFFDTKDSDEVGPVSSIVKYKSNLHVIKRWGHKVYKVSVRATPYVRKTFNVLHYLNKIGLYLQSMCLVHCNLWLGMSKGCLLVMDADTYIPVTCLTGLGTRIRHLRWMPSTDDVGCVLMSCKTTMQGNTQQDVDVCCVYVWDDDLDCQTSALQQYKDRRKQLMDSYTK